MRGALRTFFGLAVFGAFALVGASVIGAEVPPRDATVVVTVASRNGGPILADVIIRIAQLQKDPRFTAYLAPREPTDAQASCLKTVRSDPSGHLFDIARCMHVWPKEGQAPTPKALERALMSAVKRQGADALPGVRVTPYPYSQLVGKHEFDKFAGPKLTRQDGTLKPTEKLLKVLCAPKTTMLSTADCEARVRVVDRLVYDPDIFVGQTGYQVEILSAMPVEIGTAFRAALLAGIHLDPGTRNDALRVTVLEHASVRSQGAGTAAPIAAPRTAIDALWGAVHGNPRDVDLTPNAVDTAPALLIFDKISADAAGPLADWVQTLNAGLRNLHNSNCPAGDGPTAHTDAVASLLMPASVSNVLALRPAGNPPPDVPLPNFRSFIFSPEQFAGGSVLDTYSWFDREALQFLDADAPVIGLVVYDGGRLSTNAPNATTAFNTYLSNPSNILVVSAANWPARQAAPRFAPNAPTNSRETLAFSCGTMPWPSCLGLHPRVLLVGPSAAPGDASRTLFNPDGYILGGSVVRVAAPSASIPVLKRCASDGDATWSSGTEDGTSFGAPLVALLLARIIQLDPDELRGLPEAAIWRILATANPMKAPDGSDASDLVGFGEINVGRALRGASAAEAGTWGAATVYERTDAGPAKPIQAVVMPYPWNDVPKTLAITVGAAGAVGIETQTRGSIMLTSYDANGENAQMQSLDFRSVLRTVKRTDVTPGQPQLFDVYYLNPNNPKLRYVMVARRVRFGPDSLAIPNPGYCRSDDLPQASSVAGGDIEPSCLYFWRPGTASFEPLDLSQVDDIVFPPAHIRVRLIAGIAPTDLKRVAGPDSPWAKAFCRIGARRALANLLAKKGKPVDLGKLCPAAASTPQ